MLFAIPEVIAFVRYLRKLIASKREDPADDLVSDLVRAHVDGESLDAEELMGMIAILLSAGHETTTNLIGNGMLVLLDYPEMAAALRNGTIPAGPAVEELLRFAGPVDTTTPRYARVDTTIAGIDTPRGTLVLGLVSSANRDDRQFTDAGRLDLERTPNRHLSFGEGAHYCVGAALARLEGAIAFRDLLRHFPDMRLAVSKDRLRWRQGLVLSGLRSLPVAV